MDVSQLIVQVQRDKGWTDTKTLMHILDVLDRWDEERIISLADVDDLLGSLKAQQTHKQGTRRK